MEGMRTQGTGGGFHAGPLRLREEGGRLLLARPGADEVEVSVRYLRPLTSRHEVVFLDMKGREVATVAELSLLDGAGREVAARALRDRYILPVIRRVTEIDVRFGTRYWWVETDRGSRWFALREPGKNVTWVGPEHLVLRDTAGNRYEIPDLPSLDPRSRRLVGISL